MRIEDFISGAETRAAVEPPVSETARHSAPAPWEDDEEHPGWVLPNEHLSVTQLGAFLRCERAYQQAYILEDKAPASSDQVLGSAVHGAIAWAVTQPEPQPADAAGYFAEVEWDNQVADKEEAEGINWYAEPDKLKPLGARMVHAYIEKVAPRLEVEETERRFELKLPGVPVPIVGFVDLVQRGTRPAVDIKTSGNAQNTILPGWLLQGRVYQLHTETPVDWHVITKQATPQVITSVESPALLQTYSEAQAQRTRELVTRLAWRINHCYHLFGAKTSWHWTGITHTFACGKCHWKGNCPGWEGA